MLTSLCYHTRRRGRLKQKLESLRDRVPHIAEVRGPGFMNSVEFCAPDDHIRPDPAFAQAVRKAAEQKGLLLLTCGLYGNVIRFLAPLTIPNEVFTET